MQTAGKFGLYDQLVDLPETLTGEILNGQLHAQPRPAPKHLHATSRLDKTIGRGHGDGDGGPGRWWILIEPEIHFVRDIEVAVPDLAGWKRERMVSLLEVVVTSPFRSGSPLVSTVEHSGKGRWDTC